MGRKVKRQLYPQERRVVELKANGLVGKQIAEKLGISEGTVRQYLLNASNRLGIETSALVKHVMEEKTKNSIRNHALKLKEWKERYAELLKGEAMDSLNKILVDMIFAVVEEK